MHMRKHVMSRSDEWRGALRRIAGSSSSGSGTDEKRRTAAIPSIFNTYSPRTDALPKPTPANLRKFAETPVARKAINTIKDRVVGMKWRVQAKNGRELKQIPGGELRAQVLTDNLDMPNHDDSFRSLSEQVLEDIIVGGFGAVEVQLSGDAQRPVDLWPVDGASIHMRTDWDGSPSSPRYAQVTGRIGKDANIALNDDELM